jgi:adenylate cyclase
VRSAAGQIALEVNAAVTTGSLLVGCIGNAMRLEYTMIGEPVNLAAKLEKHCKMSRALAVGTAESLSLARRQGFAPGRDWQTERAASIDGVSATLDLALSRKGA